MKKSKGITLVGLIVTIIILLILASISIASLTGNGLFEKAKLAKEKQDNAQIEEESILGGYENKIDEYLSNSREVTEDDMNSMFYPNKSINLTLSNNQVTINRNGWLFIEFIKIPPGDFFCAYRNDMLIFETSVPTENCCDSTYIPVKKGDIISVTNSTYFTLTLMYYEKE